MSFNERPTPKEEKPLLGSRQQTPYEQQNSLQSRLAAQHVTPNVCHQESATEFSEAFMKQLANYETVIPEEVTQYYMRNSGLRGDPLVTKLISVATQKFISDILLDARHLAMQTPAQRRSNERMSLTPELLDKALSERGIQILRSPYNH